MILHNFNILEKLIGNTPLIGIKYRLKGKIGTVFAKCEYYNFTGSIKDRIALQILREAYKNNELKKVDTLVEATSGNTGISFSALGKFLGYNVIIIMPDWMSKERKQLIESFGAKIISISKEDGGFIKSVALAKEMVEKNQNFFLKTNILVDVNSVRHSY